MIFVTIDDVDLILGSTWTTQDKKAMAVQDANDWLSSKKFCSGLDPIDDAIKRAAAYLAKMSSQDLLYVSREEGLISKETVSAQTGTSVSTEYVVGQELGKQADMQRVDNLLKPFLCGGVGSINGWVCK